MTDECSLNDEYSGNLAFTLIIEILKPITPCFY